MGGLGGLIGPQRADKCLQSRPGQPKAIGLGKGGVGVQIEGMPQADWVLVDAGDVVVHLFRPEVRTFYQLEKMWAADAAPPVEIAAARGSRAALGA